MNLTNSTNSTGKFVQSGNITEKQQISNVVANSFNNKNTILNNVNL